jgi:hypothetical protein
MGSISNGKQTSIQAIHQLHSKASEFSKGWDDGYCEGWRDVKGQNAICPISPIPPIPPIGCTNDSYKCGYNLGFKSGSKAASK